MERIAGLAVKQDVVVKIIDTASSLQLDMSSPVLGLFGSAIKDAVHEELARLDVKNGTIHIEDHQAFDFVIRARIRAAIIALRNGGGHL